jgi:hypothetical protein
MTRLLQPDVVVVQNPLGGSIFMSKETVAVGKSVTKTALRILQAVSRNSSNNNSDASSVNDHHYPFENDPAAAGAAAAGPALVTPDSNNNNNKMMDNISYSSSQSSTTNMIVVGILIAIIILLSILFLCMVIPPLLRYIQRQIPVSQKRIDERYETIEGWLISKVRCYMHLCLCAFCIVSI